MAGTRLVIAVFVVACLLGFGVYLLVRPPAPPAPPVPPAAQNAADYGSVILRSEPPGATIWLDTRKRGLTPVQIGGVQLGALHTVRLELEGYEDHKAVFELSEVKRREVIEVKLTKE